MSAHTAASRGFAREATADDTRSGVWGSFFKGIVAAREREARRHVSQYLLGLSDEHLRHIGYTAYEINVLRSTGRLPQYSDL